MLVQCPNCKTTYKVADELLKGSTPAFRCSRCRHTFEIEPSAANPTPARPRSKPSPPAESEPELSFPFATPPKPARQPAADDKKEPTEGPAREKKPENSGAQLQDEPAGDAADFKNDAPFTKSDLAHEPKASIAAHAPNQLPAAAPPAPTRDAKNEEPDAAAQVLPMTSYMDRRASIFPYLTLFGLLTIGFSFLTALSHAHPKLSEAIVKQIPLLGAVLLRNNHLKDGILIRSMRADYQSIQGNREVFVVTGVALNQNPVVIRQVQLTGKVYNEAGKELEEQTIWLGNTISPKIIRGMTSEDIPHLQNLRPLRSFEIPPGDSVSFTIVFLKAAKGAKDFTCEVVAAVAEI